MWLIYAGTNRRFWEDFAASGRVFLNIPGFDATPGVFGSEEPMRQHLAMSVEVARFIRRARISDPARNPSSYQPYPFGSANSKARAFSAELGNITRLFVDAKVGDLVMSPGKGQYDPFLIGEITTQWSKNDDLVVSKLAGETVPTRRVKWLRPVLARRDFPIRTAKRLINRHAITRLDDFYYEDIFDTVYPNYTWQDRSKLDLYGNAYNGKDPLQPYEAARLLKYVMASVFAYRVGKLAEFQALAFDDATATFYDEALVEELYQNFNSPGKFTVIAGGGIAALIAAGLALATSDPTGNFQHQKTEAVTNVSNSLHGVGKPEATQEIDNFVNSLHENTWRPIQSSVGAPAKRKLGLSLDNSVEIARHKADLNA